MCATSTFIGWSFALQTSSEVRRRPCLIYTSNRGVKLKTLDAQNLRESKFIEPNVFPTGLNVTIQQEVIILRHFTPDFASIVIEDHVISSALTNWFNYCWNYIR